MPYTTPKRVMCPFCGSRNTDEYVYGHPGPELFEGARKPNPAIIIVIIKTYLNINENLLFIKIKSAVLCLETFHILSMQKYIFRLI